MIRTRGDPKELIFHVQFKIAMISPEHELLLLDNDPTHLTRQEINTDKHPTL